MDFKYIVNNNLAEEICAKLGDSVDAQVFWLTFFKPQKACAADEFIESLRQLTEINKIQGYAAANMINWQQFMI